MKRKLTMLQEWAQAHADGWIFAHQCDAHNCARLIAKGNGLTMSTIVLVSEFDAIEAGEVEVQYNAVPAEEVEDPLRRYTLREALDIAEEVAVCIRIGVRTN